MQGLLAKLYRPNMAMLTDLYQITMAYGYWKLNRQDEEAVFHVFFRKAPFGGYTIAAGLEQVAELLQLLRFQPDDLRYLSGLRGNDGQPLFDPGFLRYRMRLLNQ